MSDESFKIAAVQAASVFLDKDATVDKACRLLEEASKEGADFVAFPEAFVPGYPLWVWFIPPGQTHPLRAVFSELHRNAVAIDGPAVKRLCEAAADCKVDLAIGVNERNSEASDSTLFNTLLYIGREGELLGRHRKLIPTAGERLVWGQGAEDDLQVHDLGYAKAAGLLCWENYMPLARYVLTARGSQLHVAPTWDRGEPWLSTMRHVAKEGRCFVLGVCQAFRMSDIPERFEFKKEYLGGIEDWINPGMSVIVDPDGKVLAGPLEKEEGILYAEVEADQLVGPRWQLDAAGHYARPDLFEMRVHSGPRPFLTEVHAPAEDSSEGESGARPSTR